MAHDTLIKYKSNQFWIEEAFIEILSKYICETFEAIGLGSFNENVLNIYNACNNNRMGDNSGVVNMGFRQYLTNTTDDATLVNILGQTKQNIQNIGSTISVTELNIFESNKNNEDFKSTWSFPIQTQSLMSTLDILINMITGGYSYNNVGIHYLGFPTIPGYTVI